MNTIFAFTTKGLCLFNQSPEKTVELYCILQFISKAWLIYSMQCKNTKRVCPGKKNNHCIQINQFSNDGEPYKSILNVYCSMKKYILRKCLFCRSLFWNLVPPIFLAFIGESLTCLQLLQLKMFLNWNFRFHVLLQKKKKNPDYGMIGNRSCD